MTYQEAKARQAALEANVKLAGAALRQFPANGPMGLTPDSVKASPEFRTAKACFDRAFSQLAAFNAAFVKTYRKEAAAERKARRNGR